mmetsp:Transcript_110887/g.294618  ORF Transcript_110887/g.294618 Transcript_110887/m.294618 type:complete len:522 (-) Transcript_110887:212-1777(-)
MTGAEGSLGLARPSATNHVLARRLWAAASSAPGAAAALAGRSRFTGFKMLSPSSSASCSPLASMTTSTCPSATCSSAFTRTSLTTPLAPACTSLSIFMALMITTADLPFTLSPTLTLISETCPWKGASTFTVCPAANAPAAEAAGFPVTTSGLSLRKDVKISFPVKSPCVRIRASMSLFTLMPCKPRPERDPRTRSMQASKLLPSSTEQITLMIMGSYSAGTMTPCATPLSIRMPGPAGSVYPASNPAPPGSKETRAWMAQPRGAGGGSLEISSKPMPAATRICVCTRSTPVTSSVMVCSTWMRGFISRKTKRALGSERAPVTRNSTVPAFRYWHISHRRTAAPQIRALSSGFIPRAGAISTTFWFRCCTEQSRSKKWAQWPLPSPMTCTSMWRALTKNSSMKHPPSPKPSRASCEQRPKPSSNSSRLCTTFWPRPPPPKAALISSGQCRLLSLAFRKACASSKDRHKVLPGRTGTLAFMANSRALVLSPNRSRCSGRGPMKAMPSSPQRRAKSTFSAKKP